MIRRLLSLLRDRSATAAMEFAFIVPAMVVFFCGSIEVAEGVIVYLKLIDSADVVSDLVAQQVNGVASSDLTNYYDAGQMVMIPATGTLGMAIASVTYNTSGVPSVAWQVERGGAQAMNDLTNGNSTLVALGDSSGTASVIVAQATFTYNSFLKFVVKTPISMTTRVYSRPRYVTSIACNSSPCS
jgi:Flp pilus assembly protein TadG